MNKEGIFLNWLWLHVRTASWGRFYGVSQIYVLDKKRKERKYQGEY